MINKGAEKFIENELDKQNRGQTDSKITQIPSVNNDRKLFFIQLPPRCQQKCCKLLNFECLRCQDYVVCILLGT